MTDKELLELAAKAAGIKGRFVEAFPEDGYPAYSCGIGTQSSPLLLWNPLRDDGDALRLAVDLRMEIYVHENDIRAVDGELRSAWERHGGDSFAATRRAIVRAAAEIGKAMP